MIFDGVRAAYDAWAPAYDTSEPRLLRDLAAAVVRRQAPDLSGTSIFELGCGTGTNTIWFAEFGDRVIALDFSERMLDRARCRVTSDRVRFVSHHIRTRWPIPDDSTDLVVASLVLEHVDDLGPVFKEARRVLHSAGALFVCEFHPFQQLAGWKAQYVDPATHAIAQVPAFCHDVSDFVNAGLGASLRLEAMNEWRYLEETVGARPKLLSLMFAK